MLVGPHTPGFVADAELAHQLAEVGVILLMFGVGLHFHLKDLLAVKGIAIPGAIAHCIACTVIAVPVFTWFGFSTDTSIVLGFALSVASTVVLMRVFMDADQLSSPQGHVAVGWLLVEDVFTVIVLVFIPVLGAREGVAVPEGLLASPLLAITWALVKLVGMVVIILVAGSQNRTLGTREGRETQVARTFHAHRVGLFGGHSGRNLCAIRYFDGAGGISRRHGRCPIAGESSSRRRCVALRDAFAVLFFVSVGMLFDPMFLIQKPLLMLATMAIILIVKSVTALAIVVALGHSMRIALTVALGLAQIGEFSFILSNVAHEYGLMPEEGNSLLVGGAILSITLNPLLFRSLGSIEAWLRSRRRFWQFLNARAERRVQQANNASMAQIATFGSDNKLAIVVGYGPVGRAVDRLLRDAGMDTVVIDMNMDTITELHAQRRVAIFGDAAREAILEQAGVAHASHLVVTLPQASGRAAIVAIARNLNSKLRILVRAHYLREREHLEQAGATSAVFEEGEAAVALARLVLVDTGASRELVEHAVRDIRTQLLLENVTNLQTQIVRSIMVPWTRCEGFPVPPRTTKSAAKCPSIIIRVGRSSIPARGGPPLTCWRKTW